MEIRDDRIGMAEHSRVALAAVEPAEKRREPDAAGHGIELGKHEALVRQQQVGSQHRGKRAAILRVARMGDERGGFAAVEVVGDPRREQRLVAKEVLAHRGTQVERLERLVEFEAGGADGLKLRDLLGRQRPRIGRELPRLVLEQRLRGERGANLLKRQVGHGGGLSNDQ